MSFEHTKEKMRVERLARVRRSAWVVGAILAAAACGLLYPDTASAWGTVRIAFMGGMGALAALVLTR